MAYSNWGAEVYLDGKPKPENCDQTPNSVLYEKFIPSFLCAILDRKTNEESFMENDVFHAVVGDTNSGYIVLLYKSGCAGIYEVSRTPYGLFALTEVKEPFSCFDEDQTVVIDGKTFTFIGNDVPESISVEFVDTSKRKWFAKSGYCIGEGHKDWG